jgi:hypothetical protein
MRSQQLLKADLWIVKGPVVIMLTHSRSESSSQLFIAQISEFRLTTLQSLGNVICLPGVITF